MDRTYQLSGENSGTQEAHKFTLQSPPLFTADAASASEIPQIPEMLLVPLPGSYWGRGCECPTLTLLRVLGHEAWLSV